MITKNPKSNIRNSKFSCTFAPVNPEVQSFHITTCFHGAPSQANRLFNHSNFFINDLFHHLTRGTIIS
jgi:hypothetical protein